MDKGSLVIVLVLLLATACKQDDDQQAFSGNKLNKAWLHRLIARSDSSYTKPYFRRDFATASYYINKKDSTLAQVMRDSSDRVRQVIIETKGVRSFSAQFYPTGYAVAMAGLDSRGQLHGKATVLYPDGRVKSSGQYENGFHSGVWKTYDENGKLVLEEEYGTQGQTLKTTAY